MRLREKKKQKHFRLMWNGNANTPQFCLSSQNAGAVKI